jgi:hypothetical protein
MKTNRILRSLVMATLALAALDIASAADTNPPPVQMFVPGFILRELPVQLSNLNNVIALTCWTRRASVTTARNIAAAACLNFR